MITKNDLVLSAFEELRISGITVKPSPSEVASAIKRLDSMILGWQNKGLCLSYVRSAGFSDVDPNQDSGLNDVNANAVITNLAKTLCPAYGKTLHPDTRVEARTSYLGLFSSDLTMRESNPYLPTGSGHSFGYGYNDRFRFQSADKNAPENCETIDIKVGEVDFYPVDFNPYLNEVDGDVIASYAVEDGQGVEVLSHAEAEGVITLEAKGLTVGFAPIKITVTTSSNRVNPETINFNVVST
jgi:hypothetical protein